MNKFTKKKLFLPCLANDIYIYTDNYTKLEGFESKSGEVVARK